MHLIDLNGISIYEQLKLEEALLRSNEEEWCLINKGSPPAIIMGISGQPHQLLNLSRLKSNPLPVIKRYSGGGTVVVDSETLFVTFICNSKKRGVEPFPKAIMEWTEQVYLPFFNRSDFQLKENDYVFGNRKFGGNAQYIQKERWVHHTSFLWNFDPLNMDYLQLPQKRPSYRGDRAHQDFLCCLKEFYPDFNAFFSNLKSHLLQALKSVEVSSCSLLSASFPSHRQNTLLLETNTVTE